MWQEGKCEVCELPKSIAVTSLPGVPISVARCADCLMADAIPLWILVANTAAIGGAEHAARWWRDIIHDTLTHLQIPYERFNNMVREQLLADLE